MLKNLKFLLITLLLPVCSSASEEISNIKLQKIEADVVIRAWDTKGFGDNTGTSTISIITTSNLTGDIVVLRKNVNESGFNAEVYKAKPNAWKPELWEFISGDIEKSIVKQPNGNLHLFETVDQGLKVEVIDLDSKN